MGKIFKALEKAEKQSPVKPAQRPIVSKKPAPVAQDAEPVIQAVKTVQGQARQQPFHEPEDQSQTVTDVPRESKRPADVSSRRSSGRDENTRRLDDQPMVPDVSINGQSEAPRQMTPVATAEAAQGEDVPYISPPPEAPVEAAPPAPPKPVADKTEVVVGLTEATKANREKPRTDVRVRYSKTKVQVNDPDKLKNNKVLSVFEDFETTNQFKILRTQVLKKLKAIGGNSILVTSANQYEGKTFTSINLGVSIAKEFDRTVLIIDADIRRPTRHHTDFSTEFFTLNVEKGLTDYLQGDADIEDILINPGIDKLTLIPGGMPVDNSPELVNSTKMEQMMEEIKNRYPSDRLVIVDGPAILPYPDALILNRYVDGVLPVVEAERTSSEDLKKMMNHLKEVNILGVVLNKNK